MPPCSLCRIWRYFIYVMAIWTVPIVYCFYVGITLCLLPIPKAPIQPLLKLCRCYLPTLAPVPHLASLVIPLPELVGLNLIDLRSRIISLVILSEQSSRLSVTGLTVWDSDMKMKIKTAADIPMTAALSAHLWIQADRGRKRSDDSCPLRSEWRQELAECIYWKNLIPVSHA